MSLRHHPQRAVLLVLAVVAAVLTTAAVATGSRQPRPLPLPLHPQPHIPSEVALPRGGVGKEYPLRGPRKFSYPPPSEGRFVISRRPYAVYIPDFLTDSECDALIRAARGGLRKSLIEGLGKSTIRTSTQTWLPLNHSAVAPLMQRMEAVTGFRRAEPLQILRYQKGQQYLPHHDFFDPALYGPQAVNRAATFFIYLTSVSKGGETAFPRAGGAVPPKNASCPSAGLRVRPVRRAALLFYNMKPDGKLDPLSLHSGCEVVEGVKWAATLWFVVDTPVRNDHPLQ